MSKDDRRPTEESQAWHVEVDRKRTRSWALSCAFLAAVIVWALVALLCGSCAETGPICPPCAKPVVAPALSDPAAPCAECEDGSCPIDKAETRPESRGTETKPAAFTWDEWARLRTDALAKEYATPFRPVTAFIDAPAALWVGLYSRAEFPRRIHVYLRDYDGTPMSSYQVAYIWHHEALHWLDDALGLPPAPDDHFWDFDRRLRALGWVN
jgi:hypothetical protein